MWKMFLASLNGNSIIFIKLSQKKKSWSEVSGCVCLYMSFVFVNVQI